MEVRREPSTTEDDTEVAERRWEKTAERLVIENIMIAYTSSEMMHASVVLMHYGCERES
jgi:hypothetical protein